MQLTDIRMLFDYDAWATGKILDQVEQLTAEQYAAPAGTSGQSIRQVLTHMSIAQNMWLVRFQTGKTAPTIGPDDFPTLAAYRSGWQRERQAFEAFLATLDDAALNRPVSFERRGEMFSYTLWHILFQLINHNTQHRSELAEWLTAHGHSPGDLDFFFFIMAAK